MDHNQEPIKPYQLDIVPLTEGLDFNTATSLAKPGSLRDCLNYEFVDGAGLKRIDGFRLYDGNDRSPHDKIYFVKADVGAVASVTNAIYATSPWLYVENDDNPNNVPFGYMLWNSTTIPNYGSAFEGFLLIPFIKIDCPSYADPSIKSGNIKILNSAVINITGVQDERTSIVTADDLTSLDITAILGASGTFYADTEHEQIQPPSNHQGINLVSSTDGNKIDGLEGVWAERLNGVTFQIADSIKVNGVVNLQIYPGDYLYKSGADTVPILCLKAELLTGTWTSGTGTAALHLVSLDEYVESSATATTTKAFSTGQGCGSASQSVLGNLYLYRNTSAVAIAADANYQPGEGNIADRADIAALYTLFGEIKSLTSDSVWSVESENATQGSGYNIFTTPYTASSGNAEAMPLIQRAAAGGGAVKAVIPTKAGNSYTGNITFSHSAGGAATTPITARVRTIDRVKPRFHHTGWKVAFDTGNRVYGYLNKIDRYRSIDGNSYSTSSAVSSLEATRAISKISSRATGITSWPLPSTTNSRWLNFGIWNTQADTIDGDGILTSVNAADGTNYIYQQLAVTPTSNLTTQTVCLSGFGGLSAIPEGSSVKGVKITAVVDDGGTTTTIPTNLGMYAVLGIVRANDVGGYVEKAYGNRQEFLTAGGANLRSVIDGGMASTTFTAGGTSNLFGSGGIPIEELLDPDFSIGIFLETDATTATSFQVKIDHVQLEVTYELPSVRYYFANAGKTIVLHGDLVDYVVSGGDFRTGDAEGTLTIVNLRTTKEEAVLSTTDSTTPYYTILDNYDIYQDSSLTVKVGVVNGDMTFNGFDSYKTIKQNESRYTSVRANFFANDEYEAFYICSGAGRAGIFDGRYWSRIFAINPKQENSDTLDKPRHVGVNQFHLFLGYRSGSCLFSAPGQPSNFSAFDGAGEIGIGDKIHGFNKLQGNAFGVFCEESVHAVSGTSAETFASQVVVPNEGALEYTVASFGNRVIYTSKTGVTTLDQSEKYGNFLGRRLSFDVNPWLVPRITGNAGLSFNIEDFTPTFESGSELVCAYAVPYKNQYRLWFKGGRQLWLTLVEDTIAKCTFVEYRTGSKSAWGEYELSPLPTVPMYVTVSGDTTKSPKILCLFDREFVFTAMTSAFDSDYFSNQSGLYVLDAGDGFDVGANALTGIPHYALVNYQYLKNPFVNKTLRKVRLEGQSRGAAPLAVYAEDSYRQTTQDVRTVGTDISLPKVLTQGIRVAFLPSTSVANVAATGRVLSVLLVGEALARNAYYTTTGTENLASTRTTVATPSHYLQALLVQFEEGKEDA